MCPAVAKAFPERLGREERGTPSLAFGGGVVSKMPQISLIQGEQERRQPLSKRRGAAEDGVQAEGRVTPNRGCPQSGGSGCSSSALPSLLCGRKQYLLRILLASLNQIIIGLSAARNSAKKQPILIILLKRQRQD